MAFELPVGERVRVSVHDVAGRLVAVLMDEWREAGRHVARWDGKTDEGTSAASGVYFVRLQSESATGSLKIALVR